MIQDQYKLLTITGTLYFQGMLQFVDEKNKNKGEIIIFREKKLD